MQKMSFGKFIGVSIAVVSLVVAGSSTAWAVTSSSENYQVVETEFGGGGSLESCSGQYCARTSIGSLSTGRADGESYSASFGDIPADSNPLLEVIIEPGVSNLGELSVRKTAHKTMKIKVRNYLSDGYTIQIIGDPPKYQDYTMAAPAVPTASSQGTEQFAINVAANTTPMVGENPILRPSNETSLAEIAEDYRAPDLFKYNSGDVVIRSESESGQIDFTISMIVNISESTPAGHFSSDFSAVVVPIF